MQKKSIIEMISISYEWGGIEQHVKDLSKGLIEAGHKVIVVCRDVPLHVQMYSENCKVYTLPIRNAIDVSTIVALAKLIKKENVDVIHTHTSRDSWIALFATWIAGQGKVVTTRHVPFAAKADFFHTWYYNQLAGIICVSQFVKKKFLGLKPKINIENIEVIYPGIKIQSNPLITSRVVRSKMDISDEIFLIGFVGRITKEKGLDDLLDAIPLLKQRKENFRLVIVGDVNPMTPEYLDELKMKIHELGIADLVYFYGFTKDVASVMKDIDALVLPSIVPETFGLVLSEAMLAEKPVITTNTGAQVEIVQDGVAGFVVPPFLPQDLADKLSILINDRQLCKQFGEAGKKSVEGHFALPKMVKDIEGFFSKIN